MKNQINVNSKEIVNFASNEEERQTISYSKDEAPDTDISIKINNVNIKRKKQNRIY